MLLFGLLTLLRYRNWALKVAERMKGNKLAEWFRFNYSEEYYRLLYLMGGTVYALSGLVFLIKAIEGEPGSITYRIESYLIIILFVIAFGVVAVFIVYTNWRFRIRRKR